jgi:hypothetical protein
MEEKSSKHEEKKSEFVNEDLGGLKLKKSEVWKYTSIFLVILLIISVATSGFGGLVRLKGTMNAEKAAAKAVDYINANLLQPGNTAKLNDVVDKNGVYGVNISIVGRDYMSYISKDGKLLFTSGIDVTETVETPEAAATETAPSETELANIPKTDKPKLSVWIESRCPFGIQAANGLARVYDVLKTNAKLELRYMVTNNNGVISAMHGAEELLEDRRQVCVREEQGYDTFMKYMRCYAETGQTTECESKSGVDSKKLATCVDTKSTEYLAKDAADWKTIYVPKGGSGSPSFFLNDVKINEYSTSSNGRAPANLQEIVCSNMNTEASGCKAELPAANPPRGFGVIESGTAATTAAPASCG